MSTGIRVLIETKDDRGRHITGYGYITRRINAQLYEVWIESSNETYLLSPNEFIETQTKE
jgi:hypothetical protein